MKWFRSKKETEIADATNTKKNYILLYVGLSLGLMFTGYLISPYGKVREVFVAGETTIPDQLVIDASKVTHKQTMLGTLVSEKAIEAEIIEDLPQVKDVQVKLKDLNDITIEVQDYETIAYLNNANHYQRILENGIILNETSKLPMGNKPLLTKFEQGPILNDFITSFNEISKDVKDSISEIQYMGTKTNPFKISLYMNDGNKVVANITDFAEKIAYYPDILQKLDGKKGIIDMEVGVFFVPFDNTTEEDVKIDLNSEE